MVPIHQRLQTPVVQELETVEVNAHASVYRGPGQLEGSLLLLFVCCLQYAGRKIDVPLSHTYVALSGVLLGSDSERHIVYGRETPLRRTYEVLCPLVFVVPKNCRDHTGNARRKIVKYGRQPGTQGLKPLLAETLPRLEFR